jgi:hypothetical protein
MGTAVTIAAVCVVAATGVAVVRGGRPRHAGPKSVYCNGNCYVCAVRSICNSRPGPTDRVAPRLMRRSASAARTHQRIVRASS